MSMREGPGGHDGYEGDDGESVVMVGGAYTIPGVPFSSVHWRRSFGVSCYLFAG